MGSKNNPGAYDCYGKAAPDEPIFTLRAKDPAAPALVRIWAYLRAGLHVSAEAALRDARSALVRFGVKEKESNDPKLIEAMECARQMETWHKENA